MVIYLQVLLLNILPVILVFRLQFMFETKVNQTTERTLHDEVVKELALYLKQQDSANITMLLNVGGQ